MSLAFTYRTTGPGSFPLKQRGNNAVLTSKMAMPQKFYPSAGDSMFSNNRQAFIKDAGGGQAYHDASQYIGLKKINAIGKSSTKTGLTTDAPLSFRSNEKTSRNSALARVRGGGCVAPKKKGAIRNKFRSGGGSALSGTGNRQVTAKNFS
jgi:hypothetical protein